MSSHFRAHPAYVVLTFVLLFTAACSTLPPLVSAPVASQPAESPTSAAASAAPATDANQNAGAAAAAGAGSSESSETMRTPIPVPAPAAITGQVTYRQRIALRPDAVVEVELQETSRADAPAVVVGKQRIETQEQQVPIPFAIEYDAAKIDPGGLYSLRAKIIEGGLVTWLTVNAPRVLTRGAPADGVEIVVQQSSNPQPPAPQAGRLEGEVTYRQRIALSPGAVVEVTLQDISLADAPAVVIASQTIMTQGKQVPIHYALDYDAASINPSRHYTLSARITENGKLTWISTRIYPVLSLGAPAGNVKIMVDPVVDR